MNDFFYRELLNFIIDADRITVTLINHNPNVEGLTKDISDVMSGTRIGSKIDSIVRIN